MVNVHRSKKGSAYVWASDLHTALGITTPLRKWFQRMITYGFEEDEDYSLIIRGKEVSDKNVRNLGGRPKKDWAVHIEMAKHIAMIQRTPLGKQIRDYLLDLDKKVSQGEVLNRQQIAVLFDLIEILGYFTVQDDLRRRHYTVFDRQMNWWQYRAQLFGKSAKELKAAVEALGIRYKNQRQALLHLDKYELIRRAVVDLFLALGKDETYATNIAGFAKQFAEKIGPEIYDDRRVSIDFKSGKQKQLIAGLSGPERELLKAFKL